MLLGCMKAISGFGAFVILLVGLGMTGITIYGFTHSEIFLNDTSERSAILGVLIAADIIIVLGAMLGIYGLRKSNSLLICVFQILVILFLIIFFSLGIAAEVLPSKFFDGQCAKSNNPTLVKAYNLTDKADWGFCIKCSCNLKESTINSTVYNNIEQGILRALVRNETSGAQAFQDCQNSLILNLTEEQRDMGRALGAIEELFNCAGWCDNMPSPSLIYHFSDVNKGRPTSYCYNKLQDSVNNYSHVVGLGSLITAAFLLLISIINICICCHPARRKLSLKDRFVYMKDGQYSKI